MLSGGLVDDACKQSREDATELRALRKSVRDEIVSVDREIPETKGIEQRGLELPGEALERLRLPRGNELRREIGALEEDERTGEPLAVAREEPARRQACVLGFAPRLEWKRMRSDDRAHVTSDDDRVAEPSQRARRELGGEGSVAPPCLVGLGLRRVVEQRGQPDTRVRFRPDQVLHDREAVLVDRSDLASRRRRVADRGRELGEDHVQGTRIAHQRQGRCRRVAVQQPRQLAHPVRLDSAPDPLRRDVREPVGIPLHLCLRRRREREAQL